MKDSTKHCGYTATDGRKFYRHDFVGITLKNGEMGVGEIVTAGPMYVALALCEPKATGEPDDVRRGLHGEWMYCLAEDILYINAAPVLWAKTDDRHNGLIRARVSKNFSSKHPKTFVKT